MCFPPSCSASFRVCRPVLTAALHLSELPEEESHLSVTVHAAVYRTRKETQEAGDLPERTRIVCVHKRVHTDVLETVVGSGVLITTAQ